LAYWGDGTQAEVSNSGYYTRTDFTAGGLLEVIVDIDANTATVNPLTADFTADSTTGIKDHAVQFTDTTVGDVSIWSWRFGDGKTSAEQNPAHTYTEAGTFTVTLQVFNTANGTSTVQKVDYIVVRRSMLLINGTNYLKINSTNKFLKN
jgi:PKD repeat protein